MKPTLRTLGYFRAVRAALILTMKRLRVPASLVSSLLIGGLIVAGSAALLHASPTPLLIAEARAAETSTASAPGADTRPDIVKRGEYLARAGDCVACHTAPRGKLFAGGLAMETPFGTLYSPNITPDAQYGIGTWSQEAFFNMMRTGRTPDGTLIYPAMPIAQYTKVTREDSDAIFAYLKTSRTGTRAESQTHAALPVQPAQAAVRLAHAVFPRGRVPARSDQIGRMEPRRVSGRRARALHDVPHQDQHARRLVAERSSSRAA